MVQKKMRNTAEFLIECLEEEGVHYIFGIPGEENLAIINALEHSKIEFITVRHEQGAAFMADVYGRLTGKAASAWPPSARELPISSPASPMPTATEPLSSPSPVRSGPIRCISRPINTSTSGLCLNPLPAVPIPSSA